MEVEVIPLLVRRTGVFRRWLQDLEKKDRKAFITIRDRIRRLAHGALGDVKNLGDGVNEMRINYGPGYRVYFTRRGREVILLLCGGTKQRQDADIARAKRMAKERGYGS